MTHPEAHGMSFKRMELIVSIGSVQTERFRVAILFMYMNSGGRGKRLALTEASWVLSKKKQRQN